MKTITIIISEDGDSTSIDLNGFHGQGCGKVLEDFSDGDKPKAIVNKREYHERVTEKERQKQ